MIGINQNKDYIPAINNIKDIQDLLVVGFTEWKRCGNVNTKEQNDLVLFSYTSKAQHDGNWNYFETVSRGLIINKVTGEIVARPFNKFHNWLERGRRTNAGVKIITEKLDGSMATLYRDNGYKIATRGSFDGEQAIWATKFLNENYSLKDIDNRFTLIFEIIYPENRGNGPVIDYGDREDLVLLAIRDRFTGIYEPFYPNVFQFAEKHGFNIPKTYDFAGVHNIIDSTHILPVNEEGYVVEFQDGSRFKFKGDKYVTFHRLISKITFNNVLKLMANGTLDELTKELPQEFLEEVSIIIEEIEEQYYSILTDVQSAYKLAPKNTRKELAIWARKYHRKYSGLIFGIHDEKNISKAVYKMISDNHKALGAQDGI